MNSTGGEWESQSSAGRNSPAFCLYTASDDSRFVLYCTEMSLLHSLLISLAFAQPAPVDDRGRFIVVTSGVRISFTQAMSNITMFLAVSAVSVCTVLFLVGAAQLTMSRGDQTKVDNGKKLMISALVGLAIVLSSYAITSTVLYFLYEGAA